MSTYGSGTYGGGTYGTLGSSSVTATGNGSCRATFTDDESLLGDGVYLAESIVFEQPSIDQVRNVVSVQWEGGTEIVRDTASETAYGSSSQSVDTIARTAAEARDVGGTVLVQQAQPATRITALTINPAADDRLWFPALRLGIGSWVTVATKPLNIGDRATYECTIEGRRIDIGDGVNTFLVTYWLAPADRTNYATFDAGIGVEGFDAGVFA